MFLTQLFRDPLSWSIAVLIVVLSIVLHELGHGLAATWEGDPTPRARGHLTWNPVVHMGWLALGLLAVFGISFGRTPVTPACFRHRRWGEVLVSFAGPAVNLGLGLLSAVLIVALARGGHVSEATLDVAGTPAHFWARMLQLNVALFCLNMIPLPPLDGFTVLEGTFSLGNLGAHLRRLFPWTLIVAFYLVNSEPFEAVIGAIMGGMLAGVALVFAGVSGLFA